MAGELKFGVNFVFEKGGVLIALNKPLTQVDVTGDRASRLTQKIGTGGEALDLAEIAPGGYFIAINRDETDTITLRVAAGETAGIDLKPGEVAGPLRWNSAAVPHATASANTPLLEMIVVED